MNVIKLEAGTYVHGLGMVQLPKYLNYSERLNAWVITRRPQFTAKRYIFPVRDYVDVRYAMMAALRELERCCPELRSRRRLNSVERSDKLVPTEVVGVMYRERERKGVRTTEHVFYVAHPLTHKITAVYIGTDNTYLDNWDRAFDKARKLREQFEREYNIDAYWKGLDAQPVNDAA
jgi:hypothetical protein